MRAVDSRIDLPMYENHSRLDNLSSPINDDELMLEASRSRGLAAVMDAIGSTLLRYAEADWLCPCVIATSAAWTGPRCRSRYLQTKAGEIQLKIAASPSLDLGGHYRDAPIGDCGGLDTDVFSASYNDL